MNTETKTLRAGIDLGGTKIQAVIVGPDHELIGEARRPTPTSGGPAAVVSELAGALRDAPIDGGVVEADPGSLVVGADDHGAKDVVDAICDQESR